MRLFLAVTPDEALRRSIAEWARGAAEVLPAARWVPAENLHLTLRFLGETDGADLGRLVPAVAAAARSHRRFRVELAGQGTLPRRSRARVACLDLAPSQPLDALRAAVAAAAERALDLSHDPRPFEPHLTLARTRRGWRAADCSSWRALGVPFLGRSFEVTYVDLMESVLRPSGASYRTVERLSLAG